MSASYKMDDESNAVAEASLADVGQIAANLELALNHAPPTRKIHLNRKQLWKIWLYKLRRDGTYDEVFAAAKQAYLLAKEEYEQNGGEMPRWGRFHTEAAKSNGFSDKAARDWWREFTANMADLQRAQVTKHILGSLATQDQKKGADDWRRADLPDDVAWVASRKCLIDERQHQDPKPPLGELDFFECPSPQARVMLHIAYDNPQKFMGMVMDIFKGQSTKRQTPKPSPETKVAEAKREEEKKAEAPPPPQPLEISEAAKLVEKMLQGE